MKKFLILLLLITVQINPQTTYYKFTELRGMEDNAGNSQLFYRLFYSRPLAGRPGTWEENSIYRFEPHLNKQSYFLNDGGITDENYEYIADYQLWNNDYTKYAYVGTHIISYEHFPYIRINNSHVLTDFFWGEGYNIELSAQDSNFIVVAFDTLNYVSTDHGNTWNTFAADYTILSVSPYNDSTIFARQYSTLYKSTDHGNTFGIVDTTRYYERNFLYDPDSIHIYAIDILSGSLMISNNKGEPFSWKRVHFFNTSDIYAYSIDNSKSGNIYLADGRFIYHSADYGNTFSLYKVLDRKIVGIYKKPASDILYAATKYDLYEITPDTTIILKHLPVDPVVFSFFPMSTGNKWWYSREHCSDWVRCSSGGPMTIEVISDTLIDSLIFKKFKENTEGYITYYFLRIDSAEGKIYGRDDRADGEFLFEDFTAEAEDTIYNRHGFHIVGKKDKTEVLGINASYITYGGSEGEVIWHEYRLVDGFGLEFESYTELGASYSYLKGARINGILYGDTTLVGVDNELSVPYQFSLSQNYPNPFNPVTKIKYAIGSRQFAIIKVYDILGKEIATLVNEEKPAGEYEVEFDASKLTSGVYFYSIKAGGFRETKKLILVR